MRMKTLRALRTAAPRHLERRRAIAAPDATMEPDRGPGPEAVFERATGPYGARRAHDEET